MSKLIYPKDGLRYLCGKNVKTCARKLSGAMGDCSFDIPSDFAYVNYLSGLEAKLNSYMTDLSGISSKIKKADREFGRLSDSLESSARKITTTKLKKRERLVV